MCITVQQEVAISQTGNLYFVDVLTDVHFILYNLAYFAGLVFMVTQLSMKKESLENSSHGYL